MLSNLKTRFERNLIYVSLGLARARTCLDSRLGVVRKMEEPVTPELQERGFEAWSHVQ